MSYCRFAWDGSDVYVYEGSDGLTCCGCHLFPEGFVCAEPEEMIAHLAAHRRVFQFVPERAITSLWSDIPGAQRPITGPPRGLTVATLLMDLVRIENELKRQHAKLSPEDQADYELPERLTKP